jgi:hypothetical protein
MSDIYTVCHWCWVTFMLSVIYTFVIYTECHSCWLLFKVSIIYAECHLCWVPFTLSVIYAKCHLCWVSFMPSVIYTECHLCSGVQLSWMSQCWLSCCWTSWYPLNTSVQKRVKKENWKRHAANARHFTQHEVSKWTQKNFWNWTKFLLMQDIAKVFNMRSSIN